MRKAMSTPHICLACRRRLSQVRPLKVAQWQSRAGFISLSNSQPLGTTDDRANRQSTRSDGDRSGKDIHSVYPAGRKKPRTSPRGSDPGDVLESLFENSIRPQPLNEEPINVQSSLEPYKHAETLRKMIQDSYPYLESWAFFVEHFGPDAMKLKGVDPKGMPSYLRPTASKLLRKIMQAKSEKPLSPLLPTVTDLSRVFLRLGFLQASEWATMVSTLLKSLLKLKEADDFETRGLLITDLLGAWNVVCRDPAKHQTFFDEVSSSTYWGDLPIIYPVEAVQVHRKRGTQATFGLLVPRFSMRSINDVSIVALASFGVLSEQFQAGNFPGMNYSPLLTLLSRVISVPGLDISQLFKRSDENSYTEIEEYIRQAWSAMKEAAAKLPEHPNIQTPVLNRRSGMPQTKAHMNISFVNKRLHEALTNRTPRQVDDLWTDVEQWPIAHSGPERKGGILTIELANYFILVYMGLRQPNRAIDVWNHMAAVGLQPNLRTWDSMLNGCKNANDGKALEQVWARMKASQVQPDLFCWTSRIGGLIECREFNAGIGALDEMGRIWLEAAKKKHKNMADAQLRLMNDVEDAVKPTIEVVNAAIASLLRKLMPGPAYKVLSWASKFGIVPDVITYNTMLRPLIRQGHTKEAMQILQRMNDAGIQADVATFTTILEETLHFAEDFTPEESAATVKSIFNEMESAGVKPNLQTYAKIIYQLLGNSNVSMPTINAIIEHMAEQGLQTNAFIHTMLLEHYVSQDPPNLDAVRNIIIRATATPGGVDHKFWDRAVEGYARHRETGPALKILGKVKSAGSKVGWLALRMLLLALAENQEWDMARSLVGNAVLDEGGPLPADVHGMAGQHKFWALAKELDLLDEKSSEVVE